MLARDMPMIPLRNSRRFTWPLSRSGCPPFPRHLRRLYLGDWRFLLAPFF